MTRPDPADIDRILLLAESAPESLDGDALLDLAAEVVALRAERDALQEAVDDALIVFVDTQWATAYAALASAAAADTTEDTA